MDMLKHKKGQAGGIVAGIVALTVSAILLAQVFFPQIFDANTSTWDTATVNLWETVPLGAAIGMLILAFRVFGVI